MMKEERIIKALSTYYEKDVLDVDTQFTEGTIYFKINIPNSNDTLENLSFNKAYFPEGNVYGITNCHGYTQISISIDEDVLMNLKAWKELGSNQT